MKNDPAVFFRSIKPSASWKTLALAAVAILIHASACHAEDTPSIDGPMFLAPAVVNAAESNVQEPDAQEEVIPEDATPVTEDPKPEAPELVEPSNTNDTPEPKVEESVPDEQPLAEEEPLPETPDELPKPVGEPLAPGMIKLLQAEIANGLKRRHIQDKFARFRRYAAGRLASSARSSGSELTGNCRLDWYANLLRNPIKAPAEAEEFTRQLHTAILNDHHGLAEALAIAADKLDLPKREAPSFAEVTSPEQALEIIRQALIDSQVAYAEALAPLSKQEIRTRVTNLTPVMISQNNVGHTLQGAARVATCAI